MFIYFSILMSNYLLHEFSSSNTLDWDDVVFWDIVNNQGTYDTNHFLTNPVTSEYEELVKEFDENDVVYCEQWKTLSHVLAKYDPLELRYRVSEIGFFKMDDVCIPNFISEMTQTLLSKDDDYVLTPFDIILCVDIFRSTQILFDAIRDGVDFNVLNEAGNTPLFEHITSRFATVQSVSALIQCGNSPTASCMRGMTPVGVYFATVPRFSSLFVFICSVCDINNIHPTLDYETVSPSVLFYYCSSLSPDYDCVKHLISIGCDLNKPNTVGFTPLNHINDNPNKERLLALVNV